jgi:hypothetical protein
MYAIHIERKPGPRERLVTAYGKLRSPTRAGLLRSSTPHGSKKWYSAWFNFSNVKSFDRTNGP